MIQYKTVVSWDSEIVDVIFCDSSISSGLKGLAMGGVKITAGAPASIGGHWMIGALVQNAIDNVLYKNNGTVDLPVWIAVGGGSGGIAIGDVVSGGGATEVLFTDNFGNLFSDSNFTRDSVTQETNITADNGSGNVSSILANAGGVHLNLTNTPLSKTWAIDVDNGAIAITSDNITWEWPHIDGNGGDTIVTDGSGTLSFAPIPLPKDLNISSQTTGDILYFNGTNWVHLPIGTTGQVLTVSVSGLPSWA